MTTNVGGKSPKIGSKRRFRPKNREEKELRGEKFAENGAFNTETSGFGGDVRVRSAWKWPKSWKRLKNAGSGGAETQKNENWGGPKLGV